MSAAHLQLVPALASDDDALVRALKAGDPSAATSFYARTRPTVSRAVVRLIRATSDHDELVQRTMIELVMTISRFKGQCSLDSWASTLAAHVVFKFLRQQRRSQLVFTTLGDEGPGFEVPAPGGAAVVQRDLVARVREVLLGLDPAKAEVFVLHEVHGYDLKETAEILGISVANAQTRLVRGRRALHEKLSKEPELAHALENLGDDR